MFISRIPVIITASFLGLMLAATHVALRKRKESARPRLGTECCRIGLGICREEEAALSLEERGEGGDLSKIDLKGFHRAGYEASIVWRARLGTVRTMLLMSTASLVFIQSTHLDGERIMP